MSVMWLQLRKLLLGFPRRDTLECRRGSRASKASVRRVKWLFVWEEIIIRLIVREWVDRRLCVKCKITTCDTHNNITPPRTLFSNNTQTKRTHSHTMHYWACGHTQGRNATKSIHMHARTWSTTCISAYFLFTFNIVTGVLCANEALSSL